MAIDGKEINEKENVKFLGLVIITKLDRNEQIKQVLRKISIGLLFS